MSSNMKIKYWSLVLLLVFLLLPPNSWGQPSTATPLKPITIQVVSLKKVEKVEQELLRLKSHGLNPFMRHEHVRDKGMWYRIYVGQFENRAEATRFAQKIKSQGIISEFWVKQIEMPVDPEKATHTAAGPTGKAGTKIDAGHEEPASPSIATEVPSAAIPPETKPAPSHSPIKKPKIITCILSI